MDYLDYKSEEGSVEDVILEDSEYDYDSDTQYEASTERQYSVMSDLEFIAAHVDIPNYAVSAVANNTVECTSVTQKSEQQSSDDDSSDSDADNEMVLVDDAESSSESDSEDEVELKGTKFRSMLTEEEEESVALGPPKTKNELLETVLYPSDVSKVTAEEELLKVGEVLYRIDHECVVVVQAYYTTNPLNESSMLCNESGVVLGRVHEVFGPITTPYYIVRWEANQTDDKRNKKNGDKKKGKLAYTEVESVNNEVESSTEDMTKLQTESASNPSQAAGSAVVVDTVQLVSELFVPGTVVFAAKSRSSFVTPGVLLQQHGKGSDASNAHDEEPPEDELEYSDDEKELAARQERNRAKRALKTGGAGSDLASAASAAAATALVSSGSGSSNGRDKYQRGVKRASTSAPSSGSSSTGTTFSGVAASYYPQQPHPPAAMMMPMMSMMPAYGMPPTPMMTSAYPSPYALPAYGMTHPPPPPPAATAGTPPAPPQHAAGPYPSSSAAAPYPVWSRAPPMMYAAYPGSTLPPPAGYAPYPQQYPQAPLHYTHTPIQPHQQQSFQLNSSLFTMPSQGNGPPKPPAT